MRDTSYATEIATVSDSVGQSIERIYVKDKGMEEIRFSWWPGGKLAMRPLDIPEEELLCLLRAAMAKGVFADSFLRGLQGALSDHLSTGDADA